MRPLTTMCLVLALSWLTGCRGPSTGVAPMTMSVHVDPTIFSSRIISDRHAGIALVGIFTDVYTRNTGTPPAPPASPLITWAPYTWAPVTIGGTEYAYAGQTPADLVAKNGGGVCAGPSGHPARQYNSCLVYVNSIECWHGATRTYGTPPRTVTVNLTSEVLGYWTGWTIAHEIGWHKIGGHTGHPGSGVVHVGFNDPHLMFPAGLCYTGFFPSPAFPDEETQRFQLQLGYLIP